MKILTAIIFLLTTLSASAQTAYSPMSWGLNKGVTPYAFGANINGTWRDLGTVSASGVWGLPFVSLTVASAPNSERQITVSSAPSYNFPEATATEFDGDFSKTLAPLNYTVSGVSTLGQPASGYQWNPAVTPYQTLVTNTSGWNQSTSTNDGRTGFGVRRTMMLQFGQGDMVDNYTFCAINGVRPGSTHWLANSACAAHAADFGAGADHVYLQGIGDFNFIDNNYDVAAISDVRNFIRNNNTAASGDVWIGWRAQSTGTKAVDVGFSISGKHVVGLDTTQSTGNTGSETVALNMSQNQKIILNSTGTPLNGITWYGNSFGGSYLTHSSANSEVEIGYEGKAAAAFAGNSVAVDYFQFGAGATGVGAYMVAKSGTDINVGATYATSGTGIHVFKTGGLSGRAVLELADTPSSVNWLQITPSTTSNPVTISASGSDTNIGVSVSVKGTGAFSVNTVIKLKGYTVANLNSTHPCNAGAEGSMAYVTDADAPTYNTAVAGGGAIKVPVFCDGANWTSH